ncbi:hypothetical protein MPSI1_003720 [Malassezia psittaci]|uniref:EF-hand domain-containing protein n=1 Tax=Malassezia psittaci TaxID=1821823 RepID=A0AAF0JFS8_9BASI|nr:hypothetical protein MPSI1_003720 [Malassezia psittaci]
MPAEPASAHLRPEINADPAIPVHRTEIPPPRVTVVEPPAAPMAKDRTPRPSPGSECSTPDAGGYPEMQDYFDWTTEQDLTDSARDDAKPARQLRFRGMSASKLTHLLSTTFFGNLVVTAVLLVPILVIHYVYRRESGNHDHKVYVADNVEAWFIWAAFNLHVQWWIHFLVELLPSLLLGCLRLVWGTPSNKLKSGLEYYRAMNKYLKYVLYAALAWGSWTVIFDSFYHLFAAKNSSVESRAQYTWRIYQVMEFLFFVVLTMCIEKILIKSIAIRFHKLSYADRIQNMTHVFTVLDHLYSARPKSDTQASYGARSFANASKAFFADRSRPDKSLDESTAPSIASTDAKQRILSWRSAFRGQIQKSSAAASRLAAIGMQDPVQLLKEVEKGVKLDINSSVQAKKVARNLYKAYQRDPTRRFLRVTDFAPAYPNDIEALHEAFSVFDRDGNGDISQLEMKNTVLEVFKERRTLAQAMQDLNHAVKQLDSILVVLASVFVLFEALAIFDVNAGKTLSSFYSLGIAFAFVFKESAQNLFDSIIFLFVSHPFDSGDLIQLNDSVYVVKRLSLLSTQLATTEAMDLYISNMQLATSNIINYRRSQHQYEETTIQVAFDTPWEKLDAVQADLNHWIENDAEHRFVYPSVIRPQKYYYMRTMECTVGMTHAHNWQDWGNRLHRKVAFMAALLYYLRKHGILYEDGMQSAQTWDEDWRTKYAQDRDQAVSQLAAGTASEATAAFAQLPPEPLPARMTMNHPDASKLAKSDACNVDWEKTWTLTKPDPSFEDQPAGSLQSGDAPASTTSYMYFRPPSQEMNQLRERHRQVSSAVGGS